MNRQQINILNSSTLLVSYSLRCSSYLNAIPGYLDLINKISENNKQIQILSKQQEANKTGHTDNKNMLKVDLANKAFDVADKCHIYAVSTSNFVLQEEINYSLSKLLNSNLAELRDRSMLIYDCAVRYQSYLTPYGVTAVMLTELKAVIDRYTSSIISKRSSMLESKLISSQIEKLTRENKAGIKKAFMLAGVIRNSQPTVYSGIMDTINTIDTGYRRMAIRASITSSDTHEALKRVKVEFYKQDKFNENQKSKPLLVKTTRVKGHFYVQNLADGTYIIVVSKTGYKKQIQTIYVSSGDFIRLNIELQVDD